MNEFPDESVNTGFRIVLLLYTLVMVGFGHFLADPKSPNLFYKMTGSKELL